MIKNSKARKEYTCSKCDSLIKKGDTYFRGDRFMTTPLIRCQKCGIRSWECSSSEYTQTVGSVCDCWEETYGVNEDTVQGIIDELETLRDNCQDNLDNMPEGLQEGDTGQLLQERIDCLDDVICELENIDYESIKETVLSDNDYDDYDSLTDEGKEEVDENIKNNLTDDINEALSQLDY